MENLVPDEVNWLSGAGEMAERMRALDWSQTRLGPMEQWPQSLKTSVSICLASRFPIVMYWGPEYVVLYNDAYSTILGGKHPWALGQTCRDCWAEIWDTIGPMLDGVVKAAQATWSDNLLLLLRRHGYPEECYFSFSFSPIRVETGAVGGVFTAVIETTDNVIGERRLRTLRDLAARAVDAKSESDAWRIAAETLGENLYDIPFSILCQVGGPDDQVRVWASAGIDRAHPLCNFLCTPGSSLAEHLRRVAQSREVFELNDPGDWPGEIPQGAWQVPPKGVLLLPITDLGQERASGVLLAAVSPRKSLYGSYRTFFQLVSRQIATSVADARSHDEERRRAEALAEIDRAKTLFFSNVSHEFRTPLTLMLGPLEDTLAAREGLSTENRERLEVAHRNTQRLLKLVNTLLDFSRLEAGRLQATYEATDLGALTAELASVFRSAIERAGLKLIISCAPLEEAVYVDREMWEKIVFNLLSNAFKFTFEGEIEVSLRKVEGSVELRVRDTGAGIPPQELPHLFERFYQAKGARGRTFEGSGIGLALVQELAKLHGGTVRVESRVELGSTFIVSVPLGKDHLLADRIGVGRTLASGGVQAEEYVQEALHWLPSAESFSARIETAPSLSPPLPVVHSEPSPHILLADDNADMRAYVQRLLGERYGVVTAADGEAALKIARQQPPDLIVADVMMPRLDGFGLLQAIRQDPALKSTPVILLSARAGEEARIEGLQSGADDYLVKPFSARELLARVGSQLEMARMRRQMADLERKLRTEAETERSRLRELFVQTPAAIGLLSGPEHRYTFVNPEYVRVTGRQQIEDFLGKTVREALPESEGQGFLDLLDNVYATGVPYIGTQMRVFLNRSINGLAEHVYFNFVYQPMRDGAGQVEGILVHAVEVTEQVLARQEIENRERQFRMLAESIPQLVWMAEPDGSVFWYNQRWYEYTGTTPEQMKGWGWQSVHDPAVLPKVMATWKESLRSGEPFEMTFPLRGADGVFCEFLTRVHPLKADNGLVLRWFGTNTDVTAQRQAQEALRESEHRFRTLSERLDGEVRIRTRELEERSAEVVRQSEQLRELSWQLLRTQDEERRHIARELHDSAGQTLTVLGINLATLVAKTKEKAPEISPAAQKAQELVQELTKEIRTTSYLLHPPLLEENGLPPALSWYIRGLRDRSTLDIALRIAEKFGRLPRDMELLVFRLVQECLTNIHRHSGSKRASVHLKREAHRIVVEVRDEGRGISPEKLSEIQSKGAGMGIRGMRERLRQFRGEMVIDSNSAGTVVRATIPVSAEEPGSGEIETQKPAGLGTNAALCEF